MNKEKALASVKSLDLKIEKKEMELAELKKQKENLITKSITNALSEKNIGLEDFFDVVEMVSVNSSESPNDFSNVGNAISESLKISTKKYEEAEE